MALTTGPRTLVPTSEPATLKERELGIQSGRAQEFHVQERGSLPEFVRDRLQPVVIEEAHQTDLVGEDGTLHEPHKIYRIIRPAELFARPIPDSILLKAEKRQVP